MFEVEKNFYNENREILREKYLGKQIVIVQDKVIGVYDTAGEAYRETIKIKQPGTFCVKYLPANPAEEHPRISPVRFHSHA
jgi:hypothetical protein